jgi:hypothetical protein
MLLIYNLTRIFCNRKYAARLFLKRYLRLKEEISFVDTSKDESSDYVFVMWLQKNPPELVEVCIERMREFYPNLTLITNDNLTDFIQIPTYIKEKLEKGIISYANFSDYVRSCLLAKYGGVWIDSTCYLTSKIPDDIRNSDLFLFKYINCIFKEHSTKLVEGSISYNAISSYLLIAKKNNYLMKLMQKFMEEYWKENNFICHYFFWHYYLMLLKKYDKNVAKLLENSPIALSQNTQIMQQYLYKDYKKEDIEQIKRLSFLHKLSYKTFGKENISENSVYKKLIRREFY